MPTKKKSKKKSTKKILNFLLYRIIALVFITIALFLLMGYPKFPSKQNKQPIQINSKLYTNKATENTPVRIVISKVNIDLPVIEAKVVDGYWEISETTASYGLGSGYPGTSGNTVIFAHAREGLFYNLKDVKLNDIIYVFSKNKWYRYKVNKITAVYPNDISVIQPTKKETLTLYTCTGFSDEKRLIITALPQK